MDVKVVGPRASMFVLVSAWRWLASLAGWKVYYHQGHHGFDRSKGKPLLVRFSIKTKTSEASKEEHRKLLGHELAMVQQDALSAELLPCLSHLR